MKKEMNRMKLVVNAMAGKVEKKLMINNSSYLLLR
jgi:hypothetical protein